MTSPRLQDGPTIGINCAVIEGKRVEIREVCIVEKPFSRLLHFASHLASPRPRVLVVAPLSGMGPAILYDMILGLLPWHEVYCLAWKDAADVPADEGPFGLEDNITYIVETIRHLGAATHVIGVCQSALTALAATAILAMEAVHPATLTLLGGKLDTRISPTRIDTLTRSLPIGWFESVITTVPASRRGSGRAVYPGSIGWMMLSSYLMRHCASGDELFAKLLYDDGSDATGHPFSHLFFTVDDLPAEFYLDTVARVFHRAELADRQLTWRGANIALGRITETALLTIEGEMDDISGVGQTRVAHDLCSAIPAERRSHMLIPQMGHIGLFFGTRWRQDIAPRVSRFVSHNTT